MLARKLSHLPRLHQEQDDVCKAIRLAKNLRPTVDLAKWFKLL